MSKTCFHTFVVVTFFATKLCYGGGLPKFGWGFFLLFFILISYCKINVYILVFGKIKYCDYLVNGSLCEAKWSKRWDSGGLVQHIILSNIILGYFVLANFSSANRATVVRRSLSSVHPSSLRHPKNPGQQINVKVCRWVPVHHISRPFLLFSKIKKKSFSRFLFVFFHMRP